MHPVGLEPTTFGSEVVLYNVYPVFYITLRAVFVDYVHGVKSSLLSIVVVRTGRKSDRQNATHSISIDAFGFPAILPNVTQPKFRKELWVG